MSFDWRRYVGWHYEGGDADGDEESLDIEEGLGLTTSYPMSVQKAMEAAAASHPKVADAKLHQFLAVKYMALQKNGRGLLVFHQTGTGKTRLAVLVAKYFGERDPSRKVLVLAPKSLQENTRQTAQLDPNHHKYKYISLNAGNMFDKLMHSGDAQQEALDKNLGEFLSIQRDLENCLLIVDEYHNLSNAICNGSRNAIRLYDTIMATKNIRLLFLSGTPMVNKPYELVPTFNMLAGKHVLPEYERDFVKFFVDTATNRPNNEHVFMNRVYGLISYFAMTSESGDGESQFPKQLELKVVATPMTPYQFLQYQTMRDIELREESSRFKKGAQGKEPFTAKDGNGPQSSYRIRSRQASNFAVPEYAIVHKNNRLVKQFKMVKKADLVDPKYSSKYAALMENLGRHSGVGLVYSEFVELGLNVIAELLEQAGWVHFDPKGPETGDARRTFAIISGEVPVEVRTQIQAAMVSPNNKHGERIALLLISKTGAEGLDLKFIRHIHIMEPFWNWSRVAQVIARGVRFKSHEGLPRSEWTVQPYIYISTYPKEFTKEERARLESETTDQSIWEGALRGRHLIQKFERLLIRASFDCTLHQSDKECMRCYPDNAPLYTESVAKDVGRPNPCRSPSIEEVEVHELSVDTPQGTRLVYYKKIGFGLQIFHYDDAIKGYVALPETDPLHTHITKRVLELDET